MTIESFISVGNNDAGVAEPVNCPPSFLGSQVASDDSNISFSAMARDASNTFTNGGFAGSHAKRATNDALAPHHHSTSQFAIKLNRENIPDMQDALIWYDATHTRAHGNTCPPPPSCSACEDADAVSSPSFSPAPLSTTTSNKEYDSEDDFWELTPKRVLDLYLPTAVLDSDNDTVEKLSEDATTTAVQSDAEVEAARARLVQQLRDERRLRFPHAEQLTMDDVRAALAQLPPTDVTAESMRAGYTPSPQPHPMLDLREEKLRVAMERWHRQSACQQQQQRVQCLSRPNAYISCKMLVGAAHAHHVESLRRQHTHESGLSEEELRLLEDSIFYEWARLGQQVEEDLMFADSATVLRRISCSCIFDPDSDMRQYGDAEETRTRRLARQRKILAKISRQQTKGIDSLFIEPK